MVGVEIGLDQISCSGYSLQLTTTVDYDKVANHDENRIYLSLISVSTSWPEKTSDSTESREHMKRKH